MKLDGMKCIYCGSTNTHAYQMERATLWDDDFYESMRKEFGENGVLLSGNCDNVIYRCRCNECEKHFSSMTKLKVEVEEVISMENTEELMRIRVTNKDSENK